MLLIRTALLAISSRSLIKKNHLHPLFIVQLWRKGALPFLSFTPFFLYDKEGFFVFLGGGGGFSWRFSLNWQIKRERRGKEERLGNERTHVHQGPRSHLINWLVKKRKITMWHIPPIHSQQHRCKTDNRQMGINQSRYSWCLYWYTNADGHSARGLINSIFCCIDSI